MGEMIPWMLAALAVGAAAWAAEEARSASRWMRRTLAGDSAGPRPRSRVLRLIGAEPALARAESQAAEIAALRAEHERRTGEILGQLTQAVLVVDGQDRLRLANPAAQRLFKMEPGWVGKPFVPMARSADLVDFLRRVRLEGGLGSDVQLNRAPAPDIWIRTSGAPTDPATYGLGAVILVAEDITQLRRLKAVEREFIANASHDLRTPVTILRGYAETLQQDHSTMSAEDRARFMGKLVDATQRLGRLLESLLALASLESGVRLEIASGGLAAAVEEIAAEMRERLRGEGARLEISIEDREGGADPTQARRLVQNLLENAVAHARGMSRLVVRVRGARVEVEDDGPGVATAELGRLFDRFYRADRSRRQGGSGIGLSIVRQVAELHGGRAWAEAAVPRGLRVVAELGPPTTTTPTG
ncbi:MAG: sensor histidine kinase [Opitutia bacterium]